MEVVDDAITKKDDSEMVDVPPVQPPSPVIEEKEKEKEGEGEKVMTIDEKNDTDNDDNNKPSATENEEEKEEENNNEKETEQQQQEEEDDDDGDEKETFETLNNDGDAAADDDAVKEKEKETSESSQKEEKDQEEEKKEEEKEEKEEETVVITEKSNKEPPTTKTTLPPRPVKRARTAYFIFSEERRPQVQAQHQGESVAVVAKALGQLWGALTVEEKHVYQEKAAKERERVSKELEEWMAAGGAELLEQQKKQSSLSGGNGGHRDNPLAMDFPVARIRKICKLDPDVRGLSKEALLLVTKCSELALSKLGTESVRVAQLQNRRKLLPDDVAHVCSHREQFLFLKDDVKDLLRTMKDNASSSGSSSGDNIKVDAARQKAAAGSKPLTSYFGKK